MPLRRQLAGVMPVIFASAILMFLTFLPRYLGQYYSSHALRGASLWRSARAWSAGSILYPDIVRFDDPFFSYFLGCDAVQ